MAQKRKRAQPPDPELALIDLTNYEAEEATLGSIIIDPDALSEVAIFLKPEHFHRQKNRWIYDVMLFLSIAKIELDYITIGNELKKRGLLKEAGGDSYLIDLITVVPTSVNIVTYAKIVEELATRRQLVVAASAIAAAANNGDLKQEDLMGQAERMIFDISHKHQTNEVRSLGDVASRHMQMTDRRASGDEPPPISTGFLDLDRLLSGNGFERGQLVTVIGDTGMGKSSLMNDFLTHAAKQGNRAALFTIEMTEHQVFSRMIAAHARMTTDKLKKPADFSAEDWEVYYRAVGELSGLPLSIDDSSFITPMQILSKCRRLQARDGLDIIGVDYLALMGADGDFATDTLRLAYISRMLKLIAKELNIVVLMCAQPNSKDIAKRKDRRPTLADLRGSSDPNADSDVVLGLYRDEYYNPETTEFPNIAEILIMKQREGNTGIISLFWLGRYTTFRNLKRNDASMAPMRKSDPVPA